MAISGKTNVYAVIGDPIEHSLSPAMQNAAFEASQLNCTFLAFDVKSAEVGNAITGMRALGIKGLNVTMPHKNAVVSFLDEIDHTSKLLEAVNTVKNENGKLYGFNTDGFGALMALRANGVEPKGKKVVLLGAGSAARAVAFALAKDAGELSILNRTLAPAAGLANLLKQEFNANVIAYALSPWAVKACVAEADLLINATSVGMKPNTGQTLVTAKWLKPDLAVMDIVYNPIETRLARDAKAAGAKVISGVEMLIYQGAASFQIWTGCNAPVEVMREAALNQLKKVQKS
ncbi:MAG TPA: shikimate dehydrogenase [Candidatus Limnocylindrales bacterium]|nr:shikimate dehydrogenase [Candidatus Limnocylindrales bacterium]